MIRSFVWLALTLTWCFGPYKDRLGELLLPQGPPLCSLTCLTRKGFNSSRAGGKWKPCESSSFLLNHMEIQGIPEDHYVHFMLCKQYEIHS